MKWSAEQYVAFEAERTRPVRDLLQAVPAPGHMAMVDLGCGPGNSTEVLAQRFPGARIIGLDSSADMVDAARKRLPELQFHVAAIEGWCEPGPFGVILANAVLHWMPDHATLLPRLARRLAPGGSLAVQLPDNLGEPAQVLMSEIAAQPPWAGRLADAAGMRTQIESPKWYFGLLRPLCARVEVWRTTYYHPLAGGVDAIVRWFEGTGLKPFLEPLDEAEEAAFLRRYRIALAGSYAAFADNTVLLAFPRLFIVATR